MGAKVIESGPFGIGKQETILEGGDNGITSGTFDVGLTRIPKGGRDVLAWDAVVKVTNYEDGEGRKPQTEVEHRGWDSDGRNVPGLQQLLSKKGDTVIYRGLLSTVVVERM